MNPPGLASLLLLLAAVGCRASGRTAADAPPAAVESAPASPEIRLQFRSGEVSRYRSLAVTEMEIRMGPRSVGARSSEEVELTHRVAERTPEGNGIVEVTIDSSVLSCEVAGLGKIFSLDTRKPETVAAWKEQCRTDPSAHILAPLVGRVGGRIRITVAPDGRILDARCVKGSASAFLGVEGTIGIPYVLQVLGSVDSLPDGAVEVGLGGNLDQSYDSPAGLHSTKGTRKVTAWDPVSSTVTISTDARILFYPALEPDGGRCAEPGCPGLPAGFRFQDWTARAEEVLDLRRGVRLRSASTHTVTAAADAPRGQGPAPTISMVMRITVEPLP